MLLTLFLTFYIAYTYYRLAAKYDNRPWQYAVLGVATYYGSIYGGEFFLDILVNTLNIDFSLYVSDLFISLMLLPIGIICSWRFYVYLKSEWSRFSDESMNKLVRKFGRVEAISTRED